MTSNQLVRPPVGDVYQLLQSVNGLLVHFSGAPKGSGQTDPERLWFPDDLTKVLEGNAHGGVSASIVMPGDTFGEWQGNNAIGCIGVILGLQSPQSLRCADSADCGSSTDSEGNRVCPAPLSLTIQDLKQTITNRRPGRYNEWVVADYIPLGILAMPPFEVSSENSYSSLENGASVPRWIAGSTSVPVPRYLDFATVRALFSDTPLYTLTSDEIAQVELDNTVSMIPHDQIYRI